MTRYLLMFFVFGLMACDPSIDGFWSSGNTWAPVYADRAQVAAIATEAPRNSVAPGKIYAYGAYLFQVDQYSGIHIIDNSRPAQARKIGFLKVPLCTEISIKDNHLYTNNHKDLVVFDLADLSAPQLVKRLSDVFPEVDQTHPPLNNVYFECPDPSRGIIVRWEQKQVDNPKCRR